MLIIQRELWPLQEIAAPEEADWRWGTGHSTIDSSSKNIHAGNFARVAIE
jgi:hypothetical protein